MTQDQRERLEAALAVANAMYYDHAAPDEERQDALAAAQAIEQLLRYAPMAA